MTINIIQTSSHSNAHTIQLHIYMAQFPWLFPLPLLAPLCSPLHHLLLTWHPPAVTGIVHLPLMQVACKLTPFTPPFTQLSHPFQIPRTPTVPRLTRTTSGIFRLLLSGTINVFKQPIVLFPMSWYPAAVKCIPSFPATLFNSVIRSAMLEVVAHGMIQQEYCILTICLSSSHLSTQY